MNMSIDNRYCNRFIHIEDQYFLWIAAVPLFTIPTTFGNTHARCYTREAPLTQSATQVGLSLLDSSMLWLFHEAITSPIIVFTSIPTCFACTNPIAIDSITVKDRFESIGHQRQSAISSCCDQVIAQWLQHSTCSRKYVAWKYSLQFIYTFGHNIGLSLK